MRRALANGRPAPDGVGNAGPRPETGAAGLKGRRQMTTTWRAHATRGLLLIALAAATPLAAAQAGQTNLKQGASDTVDTGERGNYTTITLPNQHPKKDRVGKRG